MVITQLAHRNIQQLFPLVSGMSLKLLTYF